MVALGLRLNSLLRCKSNSRSSSWRIRSTSLSSTTRNELEIDAYNAETQRIRALGDHEVDANEASMKYLQTIIDGAKTLDDQDIRRDEISERMEMMRSKQNSMPAATNSGPQAAG